MVPTRSETVEVERTVSACSWPPRRVRRASALSGRSMTAYSADSQVGTCLPSMERISSPGWRPAAAAGEPASMLPTMGRS